jgi:hypothetical protein
MMGSFVVDGAILPAVVQQTNYLGGNGNHVLPAVYCASVWRKAWNSATI